MTQLEKANNNYITDEMTKVANFENVDIEKLKEDIGKGWTIILKSNLHDCKPVGIGKNLRIKVNANIGTSPLNCNIQSELNKLAMAEKYGADTVMDLSTGGDLRKIRNIIIEKSSIPVGTVPIYQLVADKSKVDDISSNDFIEAIKEHVEDGVDFITVHCGITKECIPLLKSRIMGVVSRGGSIIVKWMLHNDEENPLYTQYNKIIKIAKKQDVTLSLGDGLRPGCLADATDKAQISELKTLGKLTQIARNNGVQTMVEGPGHVPLDQIKLNIELQKKYCNGAPFYVLGPLVTDIAPGYDHITGAIGGALAGFYGADFLCYLTPKEHLGLPNVNDVIDGVISSKIAAHAADIAKGIKGERKIDDDMSVARSNLEWDKIFELSINTEKAKEYKDGDPKTAVCSMCGDFCSVRLNKEFRELYQA